MNPFTLIKDAVLHLCYPHVCAGCGTDALPVKSHICVRCLYDLPATGFEKQQDNPVEKMLAGRMNVHNASAQFYFTKKSVLQALIHQFKYRGNKELGHQLGTIMGSQLLESGRFKGIDILIPLPLHASKLQKRGYNQATILCNGISAITGIPVTTDAITRITATETQTKKHRIERWQNMEGKFTVTRPDKIENKKLLLVDDVITTGATIEACADPLLSVQGVELNIATLCYASTI
ncbi:MAG: phosphoribosyltransferase family protein [Niabella sp.]